MGTYAMATMAGELVDLRTGPRKGADSVRDDLNDPAKQIHTARSSLTSRNSCCINSVARTLGVRRMGVGHKCQIESRQRVS